MVNKSTVSSVVSLYTGNLIEDRKPIETYDNSIYFFLTPDFKYKGVIAKCAQNSEVARVLLKKEAEFLSQLQRRGFNKDRYRVPELIGYRPKEGILIEQRFFGKTGLQLIVEDNHNVEEVSEESSNWYAKLHTTDQKEEFDIKIKDTPTFEELLLNLSKDESVMHSFPEYGNVKKLVEKWKDKEFDSISANLHGDPHLSHLYFENDYVYGIDFNLSNVGLVHKELGGFISNTNRHIASKIGDEDLFRTFEKNFLENYEDKTGLLIGEELKFFVAKSFYDIAKYAEIYVRGGETANSVRIKFLKKCVEAISDKDKTNLLYVSWGATGGVDRIVDYLRLYSSRLGTNVNTLSHMEKKSFKFGDYDFPEKEDLIKYLKDNKMAFDIVHIHTPTIADRLKGGLSSILSETQNPEVIYTCHGLIPHVFHINNSVPIEEAKKLKYAIGEYEIMKASEIVTFPTNFQKKLAEKIYPELSSKYRVVANGSDFYRYDKDEKVNEDAKNIREKLGGSRRKNILYVGRVEEDKGVVDLAEACKNLLSRNYGINLIYVGPCRNEVKNEIMENVPNSIFVGKVDKKSDLAAWYKASDGVVIPSYHESFCMAGLEALMLGVPLVVSNIDGPKEVFVDKGWAIGVNEPGDVRGIELGIEDVLFDPFEKERAAIAKIGVKKLFDIRKVAKDYVNLYSSLTD